MHEASDEAIIESLKVPASDRYGEWSESEEVWNRDGGGLAATRELREFAKQEPQRCLAMLPKILESGKVAATAQILDAIATTELPDDDFFAAVVKLSRRVGSDEYRSTVAHALYERCRPQAGLPQPLCDLLERWLSLPWEPVEENIGASEDDQERDPVSMLWGYSGGTIEADNSFWVLAALTRGYLCREPPGAERWLAVLEGHVERSGSERTWTSFAPELRALASKRCNRRRVVQFLAILFAKCPRLRERLEGVRLLCGLQHLIPRSVFEDIIGPLRLSDRRKARQAYGELLAFAALRDRGPRWAPRKLEAELSRCDIRADDAGEDVLTGIGFVAARFWDHHERRAECGRILAKLFGIGSARISFACSSVFWAAQDFLPDQTTETLLEAVAENTAPLSDGAVSDLMGHLVAILPAHRRTILNLCRALVSHVGTKLTSISTGVFACGPTLVNIALTMQRFDDTRSDAMDLIETLLRLGLDDAFNCLNEIDLRPAAVIRREALPRRRRRAF
jgi:hypothetical protein